MARKAAVTASTAPTAAEKKATHPALALSVEEAAEVIGIGRTICFRLISQGHLRALKIYSRTVVPVTAIEEFLATYGSAA